MATKYTQNARTIARHIQAVGKRAADAERGTARCPRQQRCSQIIPQARYCRVQRGDGMMWLRYLSANQRWVFLFGDRVDTASITKMGDEGPLFEFKKDAIAAARRCGLIVQRSGKVVSDGKAK